jgi:hypothetical protein
MSKNYTKPCLSYEEKVKQISLNRAVNLLNKGCRFMSMFDGNIEFFMVKVPEIKKEIVFKVEKKYIPIVKEVIKETTIKIEKERIKYRQTPEYLQKKREVQIRKYDCKKISNHYENILKEKDEKLLLLEKEIEKLKNEKEHNKTVNETDYINNVSNSISKQLEKNMNKMKEDTDSDIYHYGILNGRFINHLYFYTTHGDLTMREFQVNCNNGSITTSNQFINKISQNISNNHIEDFCDLEEFMRDNFRLKIFDITNEGGKYFSLF